VRKARHIDEGDDVSFEITDDGVVLRVLKSIRADQAWFWTTEWQAGEREVDAEIAAGRGQCICRPKSSSSRSSRWHQPMNAPDGRATWQFGEEVVDGQPHIIWRRIGTHDIFTRP